MTAEKPDEKRIEELASGFALGELQEDELKELYDYLREDHGDDVAAMTWRTLSSTLDMKMKMSPHFADTVRHRIEHGDEKADDAFSGGILKRLGKQRKQLDPVAQAEQDSQNKPLWIIAVVVVLIAVILLVALPNDGHLPVVRHVSGGKIFQEGDSLDVNQRVDQRQIAIEKNAYLSLEWPNGDKVSVQGPATVLAQQHGLSVVNGMVWLEVAADFTIGLPDQHIKSQEQSRISLSVEDSVSVLGVETGLVSYGGNDTEHINQLKAGRALWNGEREFAWHYHDGKGIDTNPITLSLDPVAAYWSCSFTVSFSKDNAVLIARGLDERAEELQLHIEPNSVSAHKENIELWRYALSGAPRSPRRVSILGRQGNATLLSISGLDKKIQWHLHAPLDALEMEGPVALKDLQYRTGPAPFKSDSPEQ